MIDDDNITLTSLRIICNYIRYAFGRSAILPEEAVHNLGTGYIEAEYGTYEYEKDKGMEIVVLTSGIDSLTVFSPHTH